MDRKKLAVALVSALLLSASGNVEDDSATVIERTLSDGQVETIVVSQGATVKLVLHAPTAANLHLHGYDLAGTVADATPVVMTFRADHVGRFPIEVHGLEDMMGRTDRVLGYVEVRPE